MAWLQLNGRRRQLGGERGGRAMRGRERGEELRREWRGETMEPECSGKGEVLEGLLEFWWG